MTPFRASTRRTILTALTFLLAGALMQPQAAGADRNGDVPDNFRAENLVAWCIVPFDARNRSPAERAAMVKRLGLRRVAYDWRPQHVPTFEQEIQQYQKHGIEFFAFWSWHDSIEPLIRRYGIRPQIWITLGSPEAESQTQRVQAAAEAMLPMVDKTRQLGLQLGLYNHGGWGGQPANLIAVCRYLRQHHDADHVGIVYNFHHGHEQIGGFADSLRQMKPLLLCLNLNGMADPEIVRGNANKILPIGQGQHEAEMIQEMLHQQYDGPVGILDHRSDTDAEIALRENLEGLTSILRPPSD